jgi:hypothetical protein
MSRALLATGFLLLCGPVAAHDRTSSYSSWEIGDRRARVTVRLSALDVSRFAATGTDDALGGYLARALTLGSDRGPCVVSDGPRPLAAPPGTVVHEWSVDCPPGPLAMRSDLLVDVAPTHLHFARLTRDGAAAGEHVFSADARTWELGGASDSSFAGWLRLGVEHILGGYDHLAFLLALLLVGGTLGGIAQVVTGFTAAHSLTLALAALGWVRPERAPVEALIGLSIALVAAENIWLLGARGRAIPTFVAGGLLTLAVAAVAGWGRVPALTLAGLGLFTLCYFALLGRVTHPAALRWSVAFLFGLVHGFGFAAVLAEAQLDADRLVRALFGFNLGVEVGQLAVVLVTWPLLRLAARRGRGLVELGSAAVAGLGLFWFVTRAYG